MNRRALLCSMLLVALASIANGCGARPARFVDRPAVTIVGDDRAIPVPRPAAGPESRELFDADLRRSVLDSLEPARAPEAGDINALDEVPASSWLSRPSAPIGPPLGPLTVLEQAPPSGLPGLFARDARGVLFELRREAPGAPVASEVMTARLLAELGYRAAEVHLIEIAADAIPASHPWHAAGLIRTSATRWPPGIDLGPTPLSERRADDPNDRVPHPDRRTLRALRDVFAWLKVGELDARVLRDVYVGEPGLGHVRHFVLGLGDALGAAPPAGGVPRDDPSSRRYRVVGLEIVTLGLLTPPAGPPIGELGPDLTARDYELEPPWAPFARTSPADSFWIARRMLAIPRARLLAIAGEGGLDAAAQERLAEVLDARRRRIAARAFVQVTPCSLLEGKGPVILLRDEAIAAGLATPSESSYTVEILDAEGTPLAPPSRLAPEGDRVRVVVPEIASGWRDRALVRVRAERAGRPSPSRSLDLHLATTGGVPRVIGLRH